MEQTIKLRPKQLEQLTAVQGKKKELQDLFGALNNQEGVLLELILEEAEIDAKKVEQVLLEDGAIKIVFKAEKTEKKPKK